MKLAIEVTLPIKLSKMHGSKEITTVYGATKSAWAAEQAMEWLAWKMSFDKSFADRAFTVGGWDAIQKDFAREMQSHLGIDHEEGGVKFPQIPGARVQTTLSGRVKPSRVSTGEVLLEYVRDLFGF